MKKMFLVFAACAFLATSCSKNDLIDSLDQNEGKLSFNTALGKQTRAAELMNNSLQTSANSATNGIALYTYQETAAAGVYSTWFNDNLYYSSGNWTIASTRFRNTAATKYVTYFPKANVAPVGTTFADATFAAADKTPQFKYTIQAVASQEDLVAGITSVDANKTDIVVGMRHVLSQVNFGVKGYKGAQISISNIVVNNVFNSATYTYKQADAYPLGTWSAFGTGATADAATAKYEYQKRGGAVPVDKANVESVVTGDVYIFGDGGNYGPGKTAGTWYPVGTSDAWIEGSNAALPTAGMSNSLMLMPQDFTATNQNNKDAYVTFNYTIVDVAGALVADNEVGQFKLDFTASNASAYASQWQQNLRYVYIIDFTEFLNDNKLAFKVDVQTYPWENYDWNNVPGGGTGIVGVPVIGQATETQVNALVNANVLYSATCSTTTPTTDVQLITSEIWHWDVYAFSGLTIGGQSFNISFSKVIFNGKTITINVPNNFVIYKGGTEANSQTVTVSAATDVVTIKKKPILGEAVIAVVNGLANTDVLYAATSNTTAGTANVYMLADQTWNWITYTFDGLTAADESFTIDFSKIVFDGKKITINVGADFEVYIGTEEYQQTVQVTAATQIVTIKKKN